MSTEWRKCAVCKKSIMHGQTYQKCNISSCKKHVFCSVDCWDVHAGIMGHKSAWAEEEIAPREGEDTDSPRRRILITPKNENSQTFSSNANIPRDILIVVSKLKSYIQASSGMNTSGDVADILSDIVRNEVDKAIMNAKNEGRKTVMARDF